MDSTLWTPGNSCRLQSGIAPSGSIACFIHHLASSASKSDFSEKSRCLLKYFLIFSICLSVNLGKQVLSGYVLDWKFRFKFTDNVIYKWIEHISPVVVWWLIVVCGVCSMALNSRCPRLYQGDVDRVSYLADSTPHLLSGFLSSRWFNALFGQSYALVCIAKVTALSL